MLHTACWLFVALVSSLCVSTGFAQHIGEDGRLVFPERRIAAFAYLGADESLMRITGSRIKTREGGEPGSWVYEWRSIAEHYEALAARGRNGFWSDFGCSGILALDHGA